MKISDYAKAQGWLKRHASSENSAGEWEKYVALNTTPELDEAIKTIDDKFGPGTVFPASEAPIPPMTDQQAIFEFGQRNPKAGGGRIGFRDRGFVSPSGLTKLQIEQKEKTWDTLAEIIQKADIEDDMEYLMRTPKSQKSLKKYGKTGKVRFKKGMLSDSLAVAFVKLQKDAAGIKYIADKLGEDTEFVLDIFDEKENFAEEGRTKARLEGSPTQIKSNKMTKDYDKAEKWLTKNAEKFDDPQKFKKAFIKRFGNNHSFIQAIKNNLPSGFSADFNSNILGIKAGGGAGGGTSRLTKTLGDNIFSTVIYNFNDDVRKKITNEFKQALSGGPAQVKQEARKILKNSELLKKYNLDKRIHGPISRLIFKEIGEDLYRNIQTFRNPRSGTAELLHYLKDVVDPKYKSQFIEAENAIKLASAGKIKDAKKLWNINEKIMYDHKIPSSLIDLGYADEIEYIKLSPTTETFNVEIKNRQFDKPMNKLLKRYENASPENKKVIFQEIQDLKNNFSKKYGNYLDDVSITADKAGKIKFSSKTPVVTKKTDLVKSLETSLQQEKFPKMSDKEQMKILKRMGYRCAKASGAGETLECYIKDVEETKAQARKGDPTAIKRQKKAFDVAKQLPKIGKLVRQGVQAGAAGLATAFKWTGLGSPIGYAIEAAVEGVVYDYYRGKGYNHEQAFAETLIPGALKGRPEDVPWYGGAEKLIEKEKIGTRWDPSGKVNLAAKYADAKSRYGEELDKYNLINANMTLYANVADWEKDLNAQAKILKDLEPSIKPGTPEYEAYQIADERQTALMDQRKEDHKSKNKFFGLEWDLSPAQIKQQTPSDFKEKQKQKDRYKAMDEYRTTSWGDPMEAYSLKPGERFDWDAVGFGGEQGIKDKWQQIYKIGGMDLSDKIGIAGGVSKMSSGGIAGVKKVDPDELKEAQEKMKKLMKQYKNKNLDWDAVKRSYKIWTK